MDDFNPKDDRLKGEASFQDKRMVLALRGQEEFRDQFYFINRRANRCYDSYLNSLAGKRVVVVGCSDCGVTPLARGGAYVEGIDISPVSIDKLNRAIAAEGLGKYASARVMDAEHLTYPNHSIDTITSSGVLHHLRTEPALRSWSLALKPDGQVVMFEPLALHPLAALFRILTPSMRTPDEHPLRAHDFALMHKYFRQVTRQDFGLFTPVAAAIAVVPGLRAVGAFILPALEALDAAALKVLPFLRTICWLTVVQLKEPRDFPGVVPMSQREPT